MTPLLMLGLRSVGLKCRVLVNDIVLASDIEAQGCVHDLPLNEWIMPWGNRLVVEVAPPEVRSPAGTEIDVRVYAPVPEGEEEGPSFQRVLWRLAGDEALESFRVELPFARPVDCPTTVFGLARRIASLEGDELAAAAALAGEVHAAFVAADVEKIASLLAFRTDEVARAFLDDPAEDRANALKAYAKLVGAEGFAVRGLDLEKLEIRSVCDGLLFEVTHDGAPLIQAVDKDGPAGALPMFISRLESGWVVAR